MQGVLGRQYYAGSTGVGLTSECAEQDGWELSAIVCRLAASQRQPLTPTYIKPNSCLLHHLFIPLRLH